MTGILWAVGVGPGDPELLTVKAARLIRQASAIACFSGPGRESIALRIAREYSPTQLLWIASSTP